MNKKSIILHLQTELNYSCGISKTIELIIKNSKQFEHRVFSIGGDALDSFNKFSNLSSFKTIYKKPSIYLHIKIFFKIVFYCFKNRVNILHSHHRIFDLHSYVISKIFRIKTVTSVHSIVYDKKSFSYKSQNLIACSNVVKNHLVDYFTISESNIKIIHNFVDPNNIIIDKDSELLKKELNIKLSEQILLFIGRFDYEKGIDVLLRAFEIVYRKTKNIVLIMVGTGDLKAWISQYVEKSKLNVIMIDPMNKPFNYYQIADIIVLPSRVDPFPLTMLEAGYSKKAFIGSSVDGISEFIENNENGLLVEEGNIPMLAEAIIKLIRNKDLAKVFGLRLYEKVKNGFFVKHIIPKYEELYSKILSNE